MISAKAIENPKAEQNNFSDFFATGLHNTVLFETQYFVVLPTIGSLVSGWVLIVPKNKYVNFSKITKVEQEDLLSLISTLDNFYKSFYGSYVIFEHGPKIVKSIVGCGVDYAHLHIVPVKIDLKSKAHKYIDSEINWVALDELSQISEIVRDNEYLFLQDNFQKKYVCVSQFIGSQTFRKVIADELGISDKYDWKKHSFLENIKETIKSYSKNFKK